MISIISENLWSSLESHAYSKYWFKYWQKQPSEVFFRKKVCLQACNLIKKRLQHRCFPVKLAKFLRKSILKNICERLLLKIITLRKKTIHRFLSHNYDFHNNTITFEALKFLLSFCAVFANLFYKNIRSSLRKLRWNFSPENSSRVKTSGAIYVHSKAFS